jgi:hypothetical protein
MPVKCSTDKEFLYLRAIVCLLMCLNDSLFMAMFFGASIIKKLLLKFILIDGTILSSYILFSYCSIKANGANFNDSKIKYHDDSNIRSSIFFKYVVK